MAAVGEAVLWVCWIFGGLDHALLGGVCKSEVSAFESTSLHWELRKEMYFIGRSGPCMTRGGYAKA